MSGYQLWETMNRFLRYAEPHPCKTLSILMEL